MTTPTTTRRSANPWVVTWTVLAGSFAVGINFTILAVSRPEIADDLRADVSTLVWLISGPILANALFTATAGKLGDLYGHRRVYLLGIGGSVVFAMASALAWDSWSLIGFRVAGAVVGAAAAPASMAIINLMFPPAQRSKALGYWSLVAAGGPVIGLIIGGPLVDAFGWRAIFLIQVPLLAIALAMAWRVLPETDRAEQTTFDVLGNVMLGVALLALLIGVERGRSWGWGSAPTVGCFVLAGVASVLFIRVELRVDHPLLPVQYFRTRSFTMPIVVIFFAQFGYMGGFILAPKLLDEIGHESATHISTLLIPRPLTFAIAGAAAGWFMRRLGMRNIAAIGSMLVVVSLMMIAASVANSVDDRDLGVAGAAQQMSVQVATSLGMNLLDTVQAGLVATSGLAASYASSYHLGALLTLGGVVAAWFVPKRTA